MSLDTSRTEYILGKDGCRRLAASRVLIFGVGGVGGYVAEALGRVGIGRMTLVDMDTVSESNINRQIIATNTTLGKAKVEAMESRILDINPACVVRKYQCFYLPETSEQFDFTQYSYVVDAIDTVTGKIQLVMQAKAAGVPIISCMGTGNKLHPELFLIDKLA